LFGIELNNLLNILFIGDIVGEPGMIALEKQMPMLREKFSPDFIICNGENSCNGRGITEVEAKRIFAAGANVITTGNHVWENWKGKPLLASNQNVLRPFNYPQGNTGKGYGFFQSEKATVGVINIQGRTFMQAIDCPFKAMDYILGAMIEKTKIIFVDFHADATAEKVAMGHFLDGRVSAIVGTHTHIQTSDAKILSKGTAYITDAGMTGPFDSVVGMKKEIAIRRFTLQTPHKYEVATDDVHICGVSISVNIETGKSERIIPFTLPEFVTEINVEAQETNEEN
jgi:metallophosphoesterase (TIGR00282 family)